MSPSWPPAAPTSQDVSGGTPVPLEGTDLPLWGLEVDPEEATREFKAYSSQANTGGCAQVQGLQPAGQHKWARGGPCSHSPASAARAASDGPPVLLPGARGCAALSSRAASGFTLIHLHAHLPARGQVQGEGGKGEGGKCRGDEGSRGRAAPCGGSAYMMRGPKQGPIDTRPPARACSAAQGSRCRTSCGASAWA